MRLLLVVFLSFSFFNLWSQTPAERAEEAYHQQEAQRFTEAITVYESLLTEGYGSADIHFNLGMAYYGQQQLGKAILHLEKAYRIRPYDKAINKNLELLRNEQVDGLLPLPTFFLKSWWNKLGARMGPDTWAILALLLMTIGCAALAARSWYKRKDATPAWYTKWQKKLLPSAMFSIMLAIFFVLLAGSRQKELARTDQAVVTTPSVSLYVAPDEATEVTLEVHQGLRARVLDEFEGWIKLSLSDGREGWAKKGMVERV
jgi:tetratricopeptide (TPR) repeat protein